MSRESSAEVETKLLKLVECILASLHVCCRVCLLRYTLEVLLNKIFFYHNTISSRRHHTRVRVNILHKT
jgi:hypothetical protein